MWRHVLMRHLLGSYHTARHESLAKIQIGMVRQTRLQNIPDTKKTNR